jgi:hypothetical protein
MPLGIPRKDGSKSRKIPQSKPFKIRLQKIRLRKIRLKKIATEIGPDLNGDKLSALSDDCPAWVS